MTLPEPGSSDSASPALSLKHSADPEGTSSTSSPAPLAWKSARWVLAACLLFLALATIWLPAWVPGTDMPTHLMMADLLAHPDRATGLIVRHYPATSQLSVWLTVPFAMVLPLPIAAKAALTLFLAAYVAANARLGSRFGAWLPDTVTWSTAMFFGFCYAMGFTNFLVAAAAGAMFLAAVFDHVNGRERTAMPILFWSLLCMHGHIIVFGMFGLQALLLVMLLPRSATFSANSGFSPGVFRAAFDLALYSGPALLATVVILLGIRQPLATGFDDEMLQGLRLPLARQLTGLMEFGFGGWTNAGWLSFSTWVLVLARCLVAASPSMRRLTLVTLSVWTLIYFAVPFHVAGWAFAQPRALLLLFPLPVLFVLRHVPAPVATAGAALVAVAIGLGIPPQITAGRLIAEMTAEFPVGEPGIMMVIRPPMPPVAASSWVEPFHHVASYRAAQGGIMPHMMRFNPWMHSVTVHPDVQIDWSLAPAEFIGRSLDCAQFQDCHRNALSLADRVSIQHSGFDSLVVLPPHAELSERLVLRGQFVESAGHYLLRAGQGSIRMTRDPGQIPVPLTIRLSWPDSLGTLGEISWPADSTSVDLGPVPPGPVRVTVTSTFDGQTLFDAPTELPNAVLQVAITEIIEQ
jgi:hypothetical protein